MRKIDNFRKIQILTDIGGNLRKAKKKSIKYSINDIIPYHVLERRYNPKTYDIMNINSV